MLPFFDSLAIAVQAHWKTGFPQQDRSKFVRVYQKRTDLANAAQHAGAVPMNKK
jgi:hypothetical protein